jgi:hypothetical protein
MRFMRLLAASAAFLPVAAFAGSNQTATVNVTASGDSGFSVFAVSGNSVKTSCDTDCNVTQDIASRSSLYLTQGSSRTNVVRIYQRGR